MARRVATGFAARYRGFSNRRGEDWWSIIFGYPVARFVLVFVERFQWITATRITLLGFAFKIAAVICLGLTGRNELIAAIVLLQVCQVLDSMDGTLARYRGQSSTLGAFLDKVTDAVGLALIAGAVGYRAFLESGEIAYTLLAAAGGAAFVIRLYMYWVMRSLVTDDTKPATIDGGASLPEAGELIARWFRGWLRIFAVGEADLYFWVALFALLDQWKLAALLLIISQGGGLVGMFVQHLLRIRRAGSNS